MKEGEVYRLRWFTPGGEISLCGHATLATSFVITHFIEPGKTEIRYATKSGELRVTGNGDLLTLDFPSYPMKPVPVTEEMTAALGGVKPLEAWFGEDLVCVLSDEEAVRSISADYEKMKHLPGVCCHVTAEGKNSDCVTRSFAPKCGVAEDPVCGRGHCHVIPLWAKKLGKTELIAYQASLRGGMLYCRQAGERTFLSGHAVLFSECEIFV